MIREILSFGAVALGGGYLVKRYWDKKKAEKAVILNKYESEILVRKQFYRLVKSFRKTNKILANLVDKMGALGDFGESLKLLKSYTAHNELDLDGFIALDKNEANKIATIFPIIGFLDRICEALKTKEVWLDEIAQNLSESRESSESDSGESLPEQTTSEITALVEIMKAIHTLITGDFTNEPYDKLVGARELLVALKSHPNGGQ